MIVRRAELGSRHRVRLFPLVAAAFTLIELMIVLVLIGIVTAVILPEMRGTYEDALLRSTARSIVEASRFAHSRSVARNAPYRMRLDMDAGRYRIEPVGAMEGGNHLASRSAPSVAENRNTGLIEGKLDDRVRVEIRPSTRYAFAEDKDEAVARPLAPEPAGTVPNSVTFYPDGTADAMEFHLRDRTGVGLALQVHPVTARIRIVELGRALP